MNVDNKRVKKVSLFFRSDCGGAGEAVFWSVFNVILLGFFVVKMIVRWDSGGIRFAMAGASETV